MPASLAYGFAQGGVYDYFTGDPNDCGACHRTDELPSHFPTRKGPHGGYNTTTDNCAVCHTIHDAAASSVKLLPSATVKGSCMFCHDGTGGYGVYGTIAARGLSVGASHSIDSTNVVPGGNSDTGGDASVSFRGAGGMMSCNDCHSPHDANTVTPYPGERIRFHQIERAYAVNGGAAWSTSHLLKQKPTGSDTTATVYGSDWCAGCHKGRRSGAGMPMNHPVDSLATTTTPFFYDRVAIVKSDTSLETTFGTMGLLDFPLGTWHNRGFVMPYPRTPQQAGHAPICQQCHQNTRNVGDVGAVTHAEVYRWGDGRTAENAASGFPPDNPLFQNFPHETQNPNFLVEIDDDLCTNCHPAAELP
jgi:hypothetical protein